MPITHPLHEPVWAQISPQWATSIATDSEQEYRIKLYNPLEWARHIREEVNLNMLGGLVIECSQKTWDVNEADRIGRSLRYGRLLNLALSELGRVVSLDELVSSASDECRIELETQLTARRSKCGSPMTEELWLLPVSALTIQPMQETIGHKTSA